MLFNNQSYLLVGGINWAYWDRGGCAKFGLPTSDESRTGGQSGWYQTFQNADIYWSENNSKSQPGIVQNDIKNHFNSLGGTWSYLGFPEGEQWGDESSCGTLGSMQNFGGGRLYSSKFGEYDMAWSDDWYKHYAKLGEVKGDLGWPKSTKLQNDSLMFFEAGFISSKVGALGIGWWLEETKTGCEKVGRELDAISGAPQCIQEGVWNKEDNHFNTYRRVPGENGSLHKLTDKLWIVDYEAVALKDGNTQGWSVLIGNETNCSVNYVGGKAWDWYRDGNKWDSAGAPMSDTQFNVKPQYHDGQLTHYQIFANQIYSYSDNLKLGGGFLGLGTWRNYATDGVISVKEIKDVYSTTIPETKDAPYIHGYLGAPVDSEIKLNRVEVDGTTQFLVGQEFQGGYIVYREDLGRYEKILNGNGSDKLTQSMSAGGMNDQESPIVSVISGLVEGVKSAVTIEDPTDIIDIALSVLSKLFGGPIAAIFNLIGMVIGLVSFVLAIIEVGASLIKLFAEGIANALPTILFIGGAILGAVLIGSVIGGPGEAFENATTSIRKLGKVGEAVEDLRKIDIEIPDNLMKRIQDIGKKTDGAEKIESIVDDIKIDPSLLNRITGDIDKLSDDDLVSVVRKVKETGKGFDVGEFERLKGLGQLSDDVDSWFSWGRYSGNKQWESLEIKERDQIKGMILSKGDGFEGLSESTTPKQSSFDGYVIKPDGSKIPTELKQLDNSTLDTVISEIKDANKKQFLENGISNGQIKIDITNNELTNPNDIFLKAKSYYTNPTRQNYLENKVQIYINNEIVLEFNQQNFL